MSGLCPCQSGLEFTHCCGPLLEGASIAQHAEALMRSRYTAFSLGKLDYLKASWHPDFVPVNLNLDSTIKWVKLDIIDFTDGETDAMVEFEASFIHKGFVDGLHERSRFRKTQGRWLYTEGDQLPSRFKAFKPGRNDACPCGSGKKFKRCCG